MTEFELIQDYFQQQQSQPTWLQLGIGDDGAVIAPDSQRQVVVSDTLVEGVHFFAGTEPSAIAHKALAVNLSDLAAMGARPKWFNLNLTLPEANPTWLAAFAKGLFALANAAGITLLGGDTTRGPLAISITAAGTLAAEQSVFSRSGAEVGGALVIAGALGLAALAVAARSEGRQPSSEQAQALDYPMPQLEAAQSLQGLATAACDVSDGLLADLGHIAKASALGFELHGEALANLAPQKTATAAQCLFAGGDDYALLAVLKPGAQLVEGFTQIGRAVPGGAVTLSAAPGWLEAGFDLVMTDLGYRHF